MEVDWLKYHEKDHPAAWFLLEAMAAAGIPQFGNFNSRSLNVEMQVNGIEVPFMTVLEYLNNQLEDIKAKASEDSIKEGLHIAGTLIQDALDQYDN